MTKYSFLLYHQEYQQFLDDVRKLGVLHVIEKESEVSEELRKKYQLIQSYDKCIKFLNKREVEQKPAPVSAADGLDVLNEVLELQDQLEQNTQKLALVQKEINQLEPWGNFSWEQLNRLGQNNIEVKFFSCPAKKLNPEWKSQYIIEEINTIGNTVYFIAFLEKDQSMEIDADEIRLPEKSLSELLEAKKLIEDEIGKVNDRLDKIVSTSIPALEKSMLELSEDADYNNVLYQTRKEAEEKLMIVEGWVPNEKAEDLNKYLEKKNIYFIASKPEKEDKVPVLLKNDKFSKKFEVLGGLYSLPKYGEKDLTPFFAPFYLLFFGFCLGDVGYGILMVLAAMFFKRKIQKELKPIMSLVTYLGFSTILFGLISGTFFGIPLYETGLPVYSSLQASFEAKDTSIEKLLFNLALIMGASQILFGMVLKVVNEMTQYGWKFALGTIGWLILIIGGGTYYALKEFTGIPSGQLNLFLYVILGISGIFILLLNNPNQNLLLNFGAGLWNTFNMVTGLLGDLLSYIRLFALGISSAILGFVFNSLAVSMSGDIPVLNVIIMVVILVFGHGINLFMSGLGSFVHPLRLTFVEFYKNAGFAGGGKKYNPFRKLT